MYVCVCALVQSRALERDGGGTGCACVRAGGRGAAHILPKARLHLPKRQRRILDRIVQQRRNHTLAVHAPAGDEAGDGDGVCHKWLAVAPPLVRVHAVRHLQRVEALQALIVGQVPASAFKRVASALQSSWTFGVADRAGVARVTQGMPKGTSLRPLARRGRARGPPLALEWGLRARILGGGSAGCSPRGAREVVLPQLEGWHRKRRTRRERAVGHARLHGEEQGGDEHGNQDAQSPPGREARTTCWPQAPDHKNRGQILDRLWKHAKDK